MKLVVMSRVEAEKTTFSPNQAIISLFTPGDPPPKILGDPAAVLQMAVMDVDPEAHGLGPEFKEAAFTRKQAIAAVEFVERNRNIETLVVHCDAGRSRSAGLAMAIALHQQVPNPVLKQEAGPNQWIKNLYLKAAKYGYYALKDDWPKENDENV